MAAVRVGEQAYITKAPPWGKTMFKMGRLAYPPGTLPPQLRPYLLKKGDVSPIVSECKGKGLAGTSLVQCIFTGVAIKRGK